MARTRTIAMRDVSILGVGSIRFSRDGETVIGDPATDAAHDAPADAFTGA